jgi:hypothetical protein
MIPPQSPSPIFRFPFTSETARLISTTCSSNFAEDLQSLRRSSPFFQMRLCPDNEADQFTPLSVFINDWVVLQGPKNFFYTSVLSCNPQVSFPSMLLAYNPMRHPRLEITQQTSREKWQNHCQDTSTRSDNQCLLHWEGNPRAHYPCVSAYGRTQSKFFLADMGFRIERWKTWHNRDFELRTDGSGTS